MSLFRQLNEAAARHGLRFLVIGGHAVIEHGYQRGTEDADILVCKDDRERWRQIVQQLGYKLFYDGGNMEWGLSSHCERHFCFQAQPSCTTPDSFRGLPPAPQ